MESYDPNAPIFDGWELQRKVKNLEVRVKELEDWAESLEDKLQLLDTALYEHGRSHYPHPNYDPNPKYGSY